MKTPIIDRGHNILSLNNTLLKKMDGEDASRLIEKGKELVSRLPTPSNDGGFSQGLLLGLVQSGKTSALTTSIALAADNGYRLFIVLTTDNNWLYEQTLQRLKSDLPRLYIESKTALRGIMPWASYASSNGQGLVIVVSKNALKLNELLKGLDELSDSYMNGKLPNALVIDDEADQASLDTQMSKRAKKPEVQPGRINELITRLRGKFPSCTYLQVTATPQALFLQDSGNDYRPEFTILIEPGKGYIGGNTFFSLQWGRAEELIRYIQQAEIDNLLNASSLSLPQSLRMALATFFVGATMKCLLQKKSESNSGENLKFSFLCHISQKIEHHENAFRAISSYQQELLDSIIHNNNPKQIKVREEFQEAYNDLIKTLSPSKNTELPDFSDVFKEFSQFIQGTEIQVLNSRRDSDYPQYTRRYNIFIGGTKLSRGVTIENLIVTYYGRQAKTSNMDTVLQHARMYGYREQYLDITRLFVTRQIENRFRLINESEQGLRQIIENYPNEKYRVIKSGQGLSATRRNVLNPNTRGYFAAESQPFPNNPIYRKTEGIEAFTSQIDKELSQFTSEGKIQISLETAIKLIRMTKSAKEGNGLWEEERIVAALETLKEQPEYGNLAYLIIKRNRDVGRNQSTGTIRSLYSSEDIDKRADLPTLYMFRLNGKAAKGWDDSPFWVPVLKFPSGSYAIEFNTGDD